VSTWRNICEVGGVDPEVAQQGVGGIAERLQVAALVRVAVVVDPLGEHARAVQAQRPGEVVVVGHDPGVARVEERPLVVGEHRAGPEAVRPQALHDRDQAVVAELLELADRADLHRAPGGLHA
jgi:hypothetical protein